MRSLATRESGSEVSPALPDGHRRLQGGRLRPRHRRDLGHRPGRRGDRPARRRLALRDDARVRRGHAAREDRHARLRRRRGDQQVRPQGRGRRAARRAQAGAAQPRALPRGARGDAGVRHHRLALQRRRRDRALPRARRGARGQGAVARARHAGEDGRAPLDRPARHRAAGARPLPRRDRAGVARLPALGRGPGPRGAGAPAARALRRRCWRRSARPTARRWSR